MFQILGRTETRKAYEPKLRLWRDTYSNKVAKERIDLVGIWRCKRSARYSRGTSNYCIAL